MEWLNNSIDLIKSRIIDGRELNHDELVKMGIPERYAIEIEMAVDALINRINFQRNGLFIVISGIDKSGKETQTFIGAPNVKPISVFLKEQGHRVMDIIQPSYETLLGGLVKWYLSSGSLKKENAWILWVLDRAQHNKDIAKWLSEGGTVIAKRWTESNVVYQAAQGVNVDCILEAERNIVKQDITFILDINVEEVLRRINGKGDYYENIDMLKKVRENYLKLKELYKFGKIVYIDANGPPVEVNNTLISIMKSYLAFLSDNQQI